MNLKFVLKILSFLQLIAFVFAEKTNDCNDIKTYFEKKKNDGKNSYEDVILKCAMNDQGNVIDLTVYNYYLQEEDVNKILSYSTIKVLTYYVKFNLKTIKNTSNSEIIEHPGYSKFPTIITNLSELETLNFYYDRTYYTKFLANREKIHIETGSLKLSKKLKELTFSQVDFTNQNMEELSTLTNLESL
ncbi:hypothetical protein BCR32DRAFT_252079 [Anaeromyces robustus]|uniref:RNI-like protein n=1 Tax=Anaeromyces robustus TaxID=1754192 RepID=A0A1Y1UBT6_9FUNG|nr:hypothetical protein BCR32DRAFT_252079 [Anaeromyces robustus]|eukprot:ORX35508.1 hypothetical protein BCR32DRAFT_252079 [Anaeromyces robustus]